MRLLALALLCLAARAGDLEADNLRQLLTVKRVYVDRLTGGETAAQMRDILIAALNGARLFVITEKEDRADAILRGAAEDLVFTEQHSSSDGINARLGAGARSSSNRGAFGGMSAGDNESERSTERRHEALASVRLVDKDGDVIWSTTQESLGAKFRGASADVAEKITARLKEDFERARKLK
jgi:hypothetical protein